MADDRDFPKEDYPIQNHSFEYLGSKFWMDVYLACASKPKKDSTYCAAFADISLYEFDKRFKPEESKEQKPIMSEEEFKCWLSVFLEDLANITSSRDKLHAFQYGATEVYRKLTGKGE